ncbi:MAG TPA: DUF4339 domain-containing protein [Bdellovibrio sp.]|uniref:DUF4339 domain-containing protein n=1 Tax=Bdellovibrio sp. TaxID=28201 RepID=UPI002EED947F
MKAQQWYCNLNLKPQGPFSMEEMRGKVYRGEIGPQDLICDNTSSWKPASEWGVFEFQLFPAVQGLIPGGDINEEVSEWVLLVEQKDGSKPLQEGPYTVKELKSLLQNGRVSPYQYIWKSGLSGWCQLKDRSEFAAAITSKSLSDPSLA